jgi:hypothetical protein
MMSGNEGRFRVVSILVALAATVVIASCSETIEAGVGCPLLCPQTAAPLLDTTLDAVVMDTSVAGFPQFGYDTLLVLTRRGDTLDTRVVVRYDSLATEFPDSAAFRADSAFIVGLRLLADSALALNDSTTFEVYDVTDAVNDTAVADLLAQCTPANRIGSRRYAGGAKIDSLVIGLDTGRVRKRVSTVRKLRLSLRMVTPGSEQIRLVGKEGGAGIQLAIRTAHDTTTPTVFINPVSDTPTIAPFLSQTLADFQFVALAKPIPSPSILRVGGLPGRRVLMRFNIPSRIVDSASVLRATLFLTQSPMRTGANAGDTVTVHAVPIIGSALITDIRNVLEFAGNPANFPTSALVVTPHDSVVQLFDVVAMVRAWRLQDTIKVPRLIAFEVRDEGRAPSAVDFYSIEAPAGLRPKLRLTYVTKITTGRP